MVSELQKIKKLYRSCLQVNLAKDLRISHLSNTLKENSIAFNPEQFDLGQFSRYDTIFTDKELASFRGLNFQKPSDSTFLRYVLMALYKSNPYLLKNKTVTGQDPKCIVKNGERVMIPRKEPVSPQKMAIMTSIFDERIESIPNIEHNEKKQRKKCMKKLLAKVIHGCCVGRKVSGSECALKQTNEAIHTLVNQ